MNCPNCQSESRKHGKDRKGNQRFYCPSCSKSFIEPQSKPLDSMYLPIGKAAVCINLLVEGMSLRSVERLTGVSLHTLLDLLVIVGAKCEAFLDSHVKNVPVDDVECDELWCFVQMKEKTLKERVKHMDNIEWEQVEKLGDAYTFVGFERNSKLVLAWHLGRRTAEDTWQFSKKLARATSNDSFQITTDGFAPYRDAIVRACESKGIDFAQLTKIYAEKLGDAYTFVGFERNSKLVLAWHLGRRTAEDTWQFSKKLARATSNDSFQITTDGFAPYRDAIVRACESKGIDFAQLTKIY